MSPQPFFRNLGSETRNLPHSYPGSSPIERLPREILAEILSSLNSTTKSGDSSHYLANTLPNDPNSRAPSPNAQSTLFACLLTSRTLHTAALPLLYRNISPSRHCAIQKFTAQLDRYPQLGKLVRTLDVSGLAFSRQKGEAKYQEETAEHLRRCLSVMPQLEELRGPGFHNEELDMYLLQSLLTGEFGMERLRTLEWGPYVTDEMLEKLQAVPTKSTNSISKLRLRGGDERLTPVVQKLLATMPKLQRLDLSETEVSAEVLSGIPLTARLNYLSMKPSEDTNAELAKFIASHPHITSSLEVLNLEARIFQQSQTHNQNPDDLSNLLSHLPSTLKSLNISTSTIHPSNLSSLSRLCTHLTELRIGPGLQFRELEQLLIPGLEINNFDEPEDDGRDGTASKYLPVLSPIADAVAVCRLRRRINSIPPNCRMSGRNLRYLDIRSMDVEEQRRLKSSVLLGKSKLEIVEFSESVYLTDERMGRVLGAVGWRVRCRWGRCWVERK